MIYLAADHRGFKLKEKIKEWLKEWGYEYEDMGNFVYDKDDDYPDFIRKAAEAVANDPEQSRGIILGGSGQGEAMVANRYKGVRASVYYGPPSHPPSSKTSDGHSKTFSDAKAVEDKSDGQAVSDEIIKLSREHNDANILSLGAFFLDADITKEAINLWLETPFSGDERHKRRIAKFN